MWYEHPRRFPKNASGPFYTLGTCHKGKWSGDCLWCQAPEAEAPELLAPIDEQNVDTYFVRQPATPEEIEYACRAIEVCCVSALRYGGTDPAIIQRLGNRTDHCDYILINGKPTLITNLPRRRKLLRWFVSLLKALRRQCSREKP